MLERIFKIQERGSSIRIEVVAGITTFITMSYVLAVNPQILGQAGMDAAAVFTATALSAAIATAIMAFMANLPIALASGMGINAFFAYTVVLGMGYTWQFALTAVFLEGLVFLFLTLTNLREALMRSIPSVLKAAIGAGIGLFIALIGLKNAGILVTSESFFPSFGNLLSNGVMVTFAGFLLMMLLSFFKVRGALLYGILMATLLGVPLAVTDVNIFKAQDFLVIPSLAPTFFAFEWQNILTIDMLVVVFTFLFVDIFDTLGTLLAVGSRANIVDDQGNLPNAKGAFVADAMGTTVGAILGTSTVTSYIESANGVLEGGRTGLTALVVAILFLVSLLFSPLFLVVPTQATAAALIVVGLYMAIPVRNMDFGNLVVAIPACLIVIIIPATLSISNGIMWGMISYVFLSLCAGKAKELSLVTYVLAVLFILKILLA